MKTIFKVGMEVYDQVNFPNKKGKVVDTEPNGEEDDYPIEVEFEDNYCSSCYTFDGRLDLEEIPTLSTKPYKVALEGFEQKAPVRTYEEAVEWLEKNSKDRVIYADEAYINEEYERAFEALKKLTILRDYYNEGWQPDWSKKDKKYCIEYEETSISPIDHICNSRIMTFKNPEIRDKFLEEQKDLLETAKLLL